METESATGWNKSASVPKPAGYELSEYTGQTTASLLWRSEMQLTIDEEKFYQNGIILTDSTFFDIFSFNVLIGDPSKSLAEPNKTFISKSLAIDWFGSTQEAIGQRIRFENVKDCEVVGIFEDAPSNTHLPINVVLGYVSFDQEFTGGFDIDNWGTTVGNYAYMLLDDEVNKEDVEEQFKAFIETNFTEEEGGNMKLILQSLNDLHFLTEFRTDSVMGTTDSNYLLILAIIGFLILGIASINFINLTTALSVKRAKEVGVKKSLGASKSSLVSQFILETFIITLFSAVLALGAVERSLPSINNFLNKDLQLHIFSDPTTIFFILGVVIVVSVISGLYPAFILSSFQPAKVLKSQVIKGSSSSISLRRVLVVFQFVVAQFLIISSIVVASQLNYFINKPLGFNKDAVITAEVNKRDSVTLQRLKTKLMQKPAVTGVSLGVGVPISDNSIGTSFKAKGAPDDETYNTRFKTVDVDYPEIFGLDIIAGRWYTEGEGGGVNLKVVVNEEFIKKLGFQNPEDAIGEQFDFGFHIGNESTTIVGVVKNFHTRNLREEIFPLVMMEYSALYYEAGIKISGDYDLAIEQVREVWDEVLPEYVFDYGFLDENLERLYTSEKRTLRISQFAMLIAILIGCMGLYGLISFIVIQKTKEVGIRKALGASISRIMFQINKEFLILLLVAFVIAAPLSWFFVQNWLNEFAYHIDPSPFIVLTGLIINLLIAAITVSYQSIKAARTNPVEALKYE